MMTTEIEVIKARNLLTGLEAKEHVHVWDTYSDEKQKEIIDVRKVFMMELASTSTIRNGVTLTMEYRTCAVYLDCVGLDGKKLMFEFSRNEKGNPVGSLVHVGNMIVKDMTGYKRAAEVKVSVRPADDKEHIISVAVTCSSLIDDETETIIQMVVFDQVQRRLSYAIREGLDLRKRIKEQQRKNQEERDRAHRQGKQGGRQGYRRKL